MTDSANKETSGKVNAKSKKSIVCETESDPVAIVPDRGIYSCMISYCLPVALEENLLFPS